MTYTTEERLAIVEAKSEIEKASISEIANIRDDLTVAISEARTVAAARIIKVREFARADLQTATEGIITVARAYIEPTTDCDDNDEGDNDE